MPDYKCEAHGVYADGRPWSTGVHITSSQTPDALNATWSAAIADMWSNGTYGIATLYPTGTEMTSTTVALLNATMHETAKRQSPHSVFGTSTADTLPFQEATLISWRGDNTQRTGRGRQYLPALAEDQVNNNILILSAQNRIKSAITAVKNAIQADGSTFFVTPTNVKHPPKNGTPLYAKTVVTTPLVSNKPARQARRVNKVPAVYA